MTHVCKCSHVCFLNCFGCPEVEKATKEEKAEAKKEFKVYRKKFLMEVRVSR